MTQDASGTPTIDAAPAPETQGTDAPAASPSADAPSQPTPPTGGLTAALERMGERSARAARGSPRTPVAAESQPATPEAASDAQAAKQKVTDAPKAQPATPPPATTQAPAGPDFSGMTTAQLDGWAQQNPSHPLAAWARASASRMAQAARDKYAAEQKTLDEQKAELAEQQARQAKAREAYAKLASDDPLTRDEGAKEVAALAGEQERQEALLKSKAFLARAARALMAEPEFVQGAREAILADQVTVDQVNAQAWQALLDGTYAGERIPKALGREDFYAKANAVSSLNELVETLADAVMATEHAGWVSPKELEKQLRVARDDERTKLNGTAKPPDVAASDGHAAGGGMGRFGDSLTFTGPATTDSLAAAFRRDRQAAAARNGA